VVLPAAFVLTTGRVGLGSASNLDTITKLLVNLPPGLREKLGRFDSLNLKAIYLTVNYLFAPFFLLIPLMASSVVAANSFVGEKERQTLESLLFAPVDITALFVGKVLSAFIPAIVLTVGIAVVYGVVVNLAAYPLFHQLIFPEPNWFVLIFWLVPVISLFAIFFNVVISAKVKGFQEANQFGAFLVMPVLALLFGQVTGALMLDSLTLFGIGALICLLDVWFLRSLPRHFDRNKLFESQVA
jgi:ABC-type Na+ efflux pump permease subunit